MAEHIYVMGILVDQRADRAPAVQEVLTRYGSLILSRNGIPDPSRTRGIITLTLQSDAPGSRALKEELERIEGVRAKVVDLGAALTH
ncbi:MAG: hypothetical protein AB1776_00895 [Bacillota bacterium]